MIQLSNRLQCIAKLIPAGSKLADIGSDHALLPAYLAERQMVSYAIAGEVNQGPYEAAVKQVEDAGLEHLISVRKGNGLQVIDPGEVNVVSIAGMGGSLIVSILTYGKERLNGVEHLVLQPNVGEELVREWLLREHWMLATEQIIEEDGHIYEILHAVRDKAADEQNAELYRPVQLEHIRMTMELQLMFGPYLWREASPIFILKWNNELEKRERIIQQIKRSDSETSIQKAKELAQEYNLIKEVIHCLQKDNR